MNKTMLITGATSGIGKALALRAASQGYQVIACGRNETQLQALDEIENISTRRFDIIDTEQTTQALVDAHFDIAVLNAGTCEYVDVNSIEPAMFKRVFEPNFFGVVNTFAAIRPNLQAGDQVVIVDSLARLLPFTRSQAYGASKAALHYFTKSLAVDMQHTGVIIQSISPGFVKTPLTDKNDFDMPMMVSVEQSAKDILNGIEKKKASFYFPTVFALILRVLGTLPDGIKHYISLKLKEQSEKDKA